MPMQYTEVFQEAKIGEKKIIYLIFLPETYTVGNEYPHCMFLIKNKKIRYTPVNPSFSI